MGSYKKKLFIVLLLFLLINFCVCSSVNAGMSDIQYTIDTQILLENDQERLAAIGLKYLINYGSSSVISSFKSYANNFTYYPYFTYTSIGTNDHRIYCTFIPVNIKWNDLSNNLQDLERGYYYDVYNIYPVSGYSISPSDVNYNNFKRFEIKLFAQSATEINYTSGIFIPSLLINYQNQTVINYNNGINPNASPWAMLKSAIDNNTSATEDTTQAVNNLRNDFNEEESDSDYSYPTDNPTQDITESSIDSIFNLFYNKIDAWNDALMRIPIPFTGNHFDIPSNLTENILSSFPAGNVIGRLLGLIWYYLLGVYIIKDVQKYIDGLQTGEILTKSDTNIKTEML